MCILHDIRIKVEPLAFRPTADLIPGVHCCSRGTDVVLLSLKMLSQWALFLAEVLLWTCSLPSWTPLRMLLVHTSWCSQPREPSRWPQQTTPMKMGSVLTMVSGGPWVAVRVPFYQQGTDENTGPSCHQPFRGAVKNAWNTQRTKGWGAFWF